MRIYCSCFLLTSSDDMNFSLFRIKVLKSTQRDLFLIEIDPPKLLEEAIRERPTDSAHRKGQWHIGNIETIDNSGIYFAIGRTIKSTMPVLDEDTGNFIEEEFDNAPYTHVFVDLPKEVLAIAYKSSLASTVDVIARKIEGLLAKSEVAKLNQVLFQVSPIPQPDIFIRQLAEAFAIKSFTVHFTRPNPIDVEEDFLGPMERLTQKTGGSSGSTTLKGDALEADPLIQLTRSAAATGDDASATIQSTPNARLVKKFLHGQTATLTNDRIETAQEKQSFMRFLRAAYINIRGEQRNAS